MEFLKQTFALLAQDFRQASVDPFLFIKQQGDSFLAILVYVDDFILASTDQAQISSFDPYLHDQFRIKDLGFLNFSWLGGGLIERWHQNLPTQALFSNP